MKRIILVIAAVLAVAAPPLEAAGAEQIWYSAFFPGWGQLRAGHYGRGSLYLGAEILALTALAITEVQYDRTVEQYERARSLYLSATYIADAQANYNVMRAKWDDAESLHRYRVTLVGAAVGVWAVNLVDAIITRGDGSAPLSLEARRDGFRVSCALPF